MKRIMITFIGVMVAATSLMAQGEKNDSRPEHRHEAKSSEERNEDRVARLKEELNLNDEQSEKLQAVQLKYADERKEVFEAAKAERDAHRDKMEALNEQQRVEMKALLTEEQAAKLDQLHEERTQRKGDRSQRDRRRGGRG